MDRLACTRSEACLQYCKALVLYGVAMEPDQAGGCTAPEMFTVGTRGMDFDPQTITGIQDAQLVERLGRSLGGVLLEQARGNHNRAVVSELRSGHEGVFTARLELWNKMLGATRAGRVFTDTEKEYFEDEITRASEILRVKAVQASPEASLRAQTAFDHGTLTDHGLLFDGQMIGIVNRLVSNVMTGKPTLLVGDKGIAKTQAAKFVAKLWAPEREPVIISATGDMMSADLIGQMKQDKTTRLFTYHLAKLTQAMQGGWPVVFDEINVSDQTNIMRLQDELLKRPGQQVSLQEDEGTNFVIPPGFAVFATANEASDRYRDRNVLDPALRDRFDVITVRYPDSETLSPLGEIPSSLMHLALAAAVDERGELTRHIDMADLKRLVRLAHVTQLLYSVPAKDQRVVDLGISLTTSVLLDTEPLMTDCITPRTLVDTIARCAPGNQPGLTFRNAMEALVGGIDQAGSTQNQSYARQVLTLLRG